MLCKRSFPWRQSLELLGRCSIRGLSINCLSSRLNLVAHLRPFVFPAPHNDSSNPSILLQGSDLFNAAENRMFLFRRFHHFINAVGRECSDQMFIVLSRSAQRFRLPVASCHRQTLTGSSTLPLTISSFSSSSFFTFSTFSFFSAFSSPYRQPKSFAY